jgi:WD40 repeat protein
MPPRVFFCYAREDQDFAVRLAQELKERGVPVWLDQWDIPPEADWDRTIDNALRECSRMLIVLSPASVGSSEVRGELRSALDLRKPILPVLYQECDIPRQLRVVQFVDFTGRQTQRDLVINRIVSACNGVTEPAPPQSGPLAKKASRWPVPQKRGIRPRLRWIVAAAVLLIAAISWIPINSRVELRQRINSAALSPSGTYFAAATGQGLARGVVRIWNVASRREVHRVYTNQGPFWIVAWSPKEDMLAAGDHEGKIWIYDAATWTLVHELDGPRSSVKFIAWSPDGSDIATGDDSGTLWAWHAADGKLLFHASANSNNIAAAAWSPDGARLATGSWDESVAIVNARNGQVSARLQGHGSYIETVAWSPDGKWIASGSLETPYLMVWDSAGKPRTLEGHRSSVEQVAWSGDGKYLASGSKDNTVQFWDSGNLSNTGKFSLRAISPYGRVLAWSKDGSRLACGDEANVWIVDAMGNKQQKLAGFSKDDYFAVDIGGWSADGKRVAGFRSGEGVKVWDVGSGQVVSSFRIGFFAALTD